MDLFLRRRPRRKGCGCRGGRRVGGSGVVSAAAASTETEGQAAAM
jgi:hypothetical protein